MQIELPLPAWTETAPRADDDAHTLTLAEAAAPEWTAWQWAADAAPTLRTQVDTTPRLAITITITL